MSSGLVYRDRFAVAWRYADSPIDSEHLERVNASSEAFLRAVSTLGELPPQVKEIEDSPAGLSQELQRLDLKLNLVLDLISSLIYREVEVPEPGLAELSVEGVSWGGESLPEVGRTVFMELYIQRGLPKALCCYAEVLEEYSLQGERSARASFIGLSGATLSWLEKWLFRHHRRQVAARREQPSG